MLLLVLVCLTTVPLTGVLAGEPPSHADPESILLHVNDLSGEPDTSQPTTAAPNDDTQPTTEVPGDNTQPAPAVPGDDAQSTAVPSKATVDDSERSGGREGGSEVGHVSSEEEVDTDISAATVGTTTAIEAVTDPATTASPSDEATTAAAASDGDAGNVMAAPDDAEPTTDDGLKPAVTSPTAVPDEHPTVAADTLAETTPAPPTDAPTATPVAAEAATTPAPTPTSTQPEPSTKESASDELPVRLDALTPSQPTLSRQRADPDFAPSETKLSKGRTGVPDPEMLDNHSKGRKGAPPPAEEPLVIPPPPPPPPPPASFPGGLSVTEGDPVTFKVESTQPTSSPGADFFGKNTLPGPSLTEKTGDQPTPKNKSEEEEATARPKPTEAKDETGGESGLRGSAIAGVVVLVLLLAFIGFFVFRKVRESWYRRHYRKMDFLVDGMYNL